MLVNIVMRFYLSHALVDPLFSPALVRMMGFRRRAQTFLGAISGGDAGGTRDLAKRAVSEMCVKKLKPKVLQRMAL